MASSRTLLLSRHLLLLRPSLRYCRALPSLTTTTTASTPITSPTANSSIHLGPRPFSTSPSRLHPRKDSQDRHSMNTEATEYSKSGTDHSSAAQEEAAFDPSTTDPAAQKDIAGKGHEGEEGGNPLEVSPANKEVSKQRGEQEGGAERSPKDEGARQSGFGSGKKGGS